MTGQRRMVTQKPEDGEELNSSGIRFDEIDPSGELEVVDENKSARAGTVKYPANCVVVHYREKTITRRFSPKQVVKSGGDLVRVYDESNHGEDYSELANEFIEGMQTQDENSSERPKFLKKIVYEKGKVVKD